MTPPRFSIVLPTHNRADVVPFAIRSALWQTADDFELLIAGDGCTDATADLVASFGDPRIRWFDLPKAPGVGYTNRNVVLREARGRDIAYLAHDDLWFPDHLARLGTLIDATGAELVYSRGIAVGLDGRMMPYWYNLGVPAHQAGLWRGESAITMCAVAHARSCLAAYGYWNETMLRSADVEMWHRIAASRDFANVAFLDEPTSLHFVANWRNTAAYRTRAWIAHRLVDGFLDRVRPRALRLPVGPHETPQETAWRRLAANPLERTREIREAVIQLHDAMLWKARTPAGLIGLRAGLALGTALEKTSRALMLLASPRRRRLFENLRRATSPLRRAAATPVTQGVVHDEGDGIDPRPDAGRGAARRPDVDARRTGGATAGRRREDTAAPGARR